jgi:hypothetical protein
VELIWSSIALRRWHLRRTSSGRGERICADTTVTNPADPGHERAEPRLPGLGDRVDKPQRGLHVTGFGEGDSRGFVSRSGENRVRTCVEHGAETTGYTSPSRAPGSVPKERSGTGADHEPRVGSTGDNRRHVGASRTTPPGHIGRRRRTA